MTRGCAVRRIVQIAREAKARSGRTMQRDDRDGGLWQVRVSE
jgi:hypothetical protein